MTAPTIAFVWNTPRKATERCIRRQVLGTRRFSAVVLTERGAAPVPDFPVPVLRVPARRSAWRKLFLKYVVRAPRAVYNAKTDGLRLLARKLGVGLVHVFFGTKAIKYRRALGRLEIPVSISFHGADVASCAAPEHASELREVFTLVDCVMARSDYMAGELERMGCPRDKLWINRTGIPLDEFSFVDRTERTVERFTFLQSGRLMEKKGIDLTIDAFARLRPHLPGSRLWIAGQGPLHSQLEAQVARLGLGGAVRLLGFLQPKALLLHLRQADLFVHPSRTASNGDEEGIPNSLLEAMATGLPAVSTRHAGIPEAIRDGENGWLVRENSVDELAERMLRCARDREALAMVGRAARASIERDHALVDRMRLLDEKYAELIEARRGRMPRFGRALANAS